MEHQLINEDRWYPVAGIGSISIVKSEESLKRLAKNIKSITKQIEEEEQEKK
jgi:hypothetical protein